ncbi:MAG: geranylgeranylglyceryl/heptaprenylglyceryl phosphate synthase [Candidatus Thermoplasmatota archaeon]|jgi:phosphoglycerol geranylgeranyltransferase|nr:geranylgeranylglyceryl/heptaprenylglyceryl phosphate synthase [Candidatus Thermoplasmatota archaeon]MCL5789151.1 geranylgeranylglyceryl/heptaprenylglyceryl phosphate synthase [Candidatus Thermoplasmatota archaeon]
MILENIKYGRIRHLTLLDPEKNGPENTGSVIDFINRAGSDAILVGGSTGTGKKSVDELVVAIKKLTRKPVILFPSSPDAFSPRADGIFYLSLLNSMDLKYVMGYQVQSARLLKGTRMEVISVAYLVFEPGMTVGKVGGAKLIGRDDVSSALDYATAAELIGFHAIYLEAGSGAPMSIDPKVVKAVCEDMTIPVIVGGGIRDPITARKMIDSGAAAVVTGTVAEKDPEMLGKIVRAIKD